MDTTQWRKVALAAVGVLAMTPMGCSSSTVAPDDGGGETDLGTAGDAAADGGDGETDGGDASGCLCTSDRDCDDGVYCDGEERCGGCALGCMPGTPVACAPGGACDERSRTCVRPGCAAEQRFYADRDGDGYGDVSRPVWACSAPVGHVRVSGDCDDSDADVHPGARELCDGAVDENCDGSVDEGCPCTSGSMRACGSAAGRCTRGTQVCETREGRLSWSGCGGTRPRAETCDGEDDDCDGMVDEDGAALCGGAACVAGGCASRTVAGVSVWDEGTLVWLSDGSLWWTGQATATMSSRPTSLLPVRYDGSGYVLEAHGTDGLACARMAEGWLSCFGYSTSIPGAREFEVRSGPGIRTPGTEGAEAFAVAGVAGVACFVRAGRVLCWGYDPADAPSVSPPSSRTDIVEVRGITDAVDVVAMQATMCARSADGSVRCWGRGTFGELGNGTRTPWTNVPVRVAGIDDAVDLAASPAHACAERRDGSIACWGNNELGALGDGTRTNRDRPVRVTASFPAGSRLARSLALAASCVRSPAGEVWCWGSAIDGVLGDGSGDDALGGVRVPGLSGVVSLTGRGETYCAARPDRVDCWGRAGVGKLGNGSNVSAPRPVRMLDVP
jgi:hypothetical protein